jgi:hypothetical protein
MNIVLDEFMKVFATRREPKEGSPLCFIEFRDSSGRDIYQSRIAVYRVYSDERETTVDYKYVDHENFASSSVMSDWAVSSAAYEITRILPVNFRDEGDGVFPRKYAPLLQVA